MLCEDSGRSYLKHSARLLEHLSRTDGLTAGELAKALDIGRSGVSQWCIRGCAKGEVAIVGSKLNKGVAARIYAVVSPGDTMTADELNGQGLAAVVVSLDGMTGEERHDAQEG
jgi:predicted ArsR family transcriptional regulator